MLRVFMIRLGRRMNEMTGNTTMAPATVVINAKHA
jgi:hypothetical protein